jgi:hypothetical protein
LREARTTVEDKLGSVVSVDQDDDVRVGLFGTSAPDRFAAFEKRLPGGIRLVLLVVESEAGQVGLVTGCGPGMAVTLPAGGDIVGVSAPGPDYAGGLSGGPGYWAVANLTAGDTLHVRAGTRHAT